MSFLRPNKETVLLFQTCSYIGLLVFFADYISNDTLPMPLSNYAFFTLLLFCVYYFPHKLLAGLLAAREPSILYFSVIGAFESLLFLGIMVAYGEAKGLKEISSLTLTVMSCGAIAGVIYYICDTRYDRVFKAGFKSVYSRLIAKPNALWRDAKKREAQSRHLYPMLFITTLCLWYMVAAIRAYYHGGNIVIIIVHVVAIYTYYAMLLYSPYLMIKNMNNVDSKTSLIINRLAIFLWLLFDVYLILRNIFVRLAI